MDSERISIHVIVMGGGGGHFATYDALRAIVEQRNLPWDLSATDMNDIVARLVDKGKAIEVHSLMGTSAPETYTQMQKNGWTWLQPMMIYLYKFLIALNFKAGVQIMEEVWQELKPDLVVSLVPLYQKVLWDSLQEALPGTDLVTIFTDFADCPPAFWIEPKAKNYLVCGTAKAVEQAENLGVEQARIIKTSGLIVHPRFYESNSLNRGEHRQKLGLEPDCLTAVVLFGGNGSKLMLDIASRLEKFADKLQIIFLCGRNEMIAEELRSRQNHQKWFITTFTDDIPYYMHLADFFIGKPGNVSLSEALVMKLPVIVEQNWTTLPQERYATQWVQQQEMGLVVSSFGDIETAVKQFLIPENFARYRNNVTALDNRAVFEIPDILQNILAGSLKIQAPELLEQKQ